MSFESMLLIESKAWIFLLSSSSNNSFRAFFEIIDYLPQFVIVHQAESWNLSPIKINLQMGRMSIDFLWRNWRLRESRSGGAIK